MGLRFADWTAARTLLGIVEFKMRVKKPDRDGFVVPAKLHLCGLFFTGRLELTPKNELRGIGRTPLLREERALQKPQKSQEMDGLHVADLEGGADL